MEKQMLAPWKAMILSFAGFTVFSVGDAMVKYETRTYPVMQCIFFALAGGLIAMLLWSLRQGGPRQAFRTRAPRIQAARAFCLGMEFILVFYAFSQLPLATVYTIVLSAPLLTVFLSPLIAGDHFNPRLLPAVLTGFAGVIVALRPDVMPLSLASAGALLSALMFAAGSCLVRLMPRDEPPLTFALYPNLFTLVIAGGFMAVTQPALPALPDMLIMMATGLTSAGGLMLLGKALQLAPAGLVMPFQYSQLLWGIFFGLLVFGDTITVSVAVGAVLIVAGGALLAWLGREPGKAGPQV